MIACCKILGEKNKKHGNIACNDIQMSATCQLHSSLMKVFASGKKMKQQ